MTYRTAKPGQTVFYALNHWEEREAVEFISYYKSHADLVKPNGAVIRLKNGMPLHTEVSKIYKEKGQEID